MDPKRSTCPNERLWWATTQKQARSWYYKLLDVAPELISTGSWFDFNWISISCSKTFKSPFVPFTFALRLSSRKIKFNCYGLISSGTGFGSDIHVAYTTARHKYPQGHANWRLFRDICLSFSDNVFKAIRSLGKKMLVWRHQFIWGEELRVSALACRPRLSVML